MAIEMNSSQHLHDHEIIAIPAADRSFNKSRLHASRQFLRASTQVRLAQQGPQALSDIELLSLLLHAGSGTSTHELGLNLLTHFGSLRALFQANPEATRSRGLTFGNFATLQAALELARRHYQELMKVGSVLSDPRTTGEFLRMRMRDLPYEVFAALYLDNRRRVLHFQELFRGTIDGASVYPREVVKEALAHNAAAVIVAHNHPSGVADPSQADELITQHLKEALKLVDIKLLDHLIVGDGVVTSFAERGLL